MPEDEEIARDFWELDSLEQNIYDLDTEYFRLSSSPEKLSRSAEERKHNHDERVRCKELQISLVRKQISEFAFLNLAGTRLSDVTEYVNGLLPKRKARLASLMFLTTV